MYGAAMSTSTRRMAWRGATISAVGVAAGAFVCAAILLLVRRVRGEALSLSMLVRVLAPMCWDCGHPAFRWPDSHCLSPREELIARMARGRRARPPGLTAMWVPPYGIRLRAGLARDGSSGGRLRGWEGLLLKNLELACYSMLEEKVTRASYDITTKYIRITAGKALCLGAGSTSLLAVSRPTLHQIVLT